MSGRGLLQITLKSANDLHKHDLFGKQQPYCQVDCGKYSVKGKTCKDGGQNPTWGETLFFQLSNETDVLVTVFAEHQLSKDAAIGTAVIPILQVRQTGHEDMSAPVMLKGKQAGTLHVRLEFKGPTLTTYGQVGQMTSADAAAAAASSRRSRQGIFGGGGSFTSGSGSDQSQSLRLASMPIRLLQQPGSSLVAAQQQAPYQQPGPYQQPAYQSYVGLQTSQSIVQQPAAQQQALGGARELLLQRQLSVPVMPHDMAALQQLYSQQLQQLQLLQTQLLGRLPTELQQEQQNLLRQQQQLLNQGMQRARSGTSQLPEGQQQGRRKLSGSGLQLPRQPRKTAADLFRPDSSMVGSDSGASLQQPLDSRLGLDNADFLDEDSDALLSEGASTFSFDNMARLQAIIQKVYPDRNISSIWGPTHSAACSAAAGQRGFGAAQVAQAAAAPQPAVPVAARPSSRQSFGTTPTSTGAFGAAAALAAAAAAGISYDSNVSGMGTFAGASGTAAAAAALHNSSVGGSGQAAPFVMRSRNPDQLLQPPSRAGSNREAQPAKAGALEPSTSGLSAQSAPPVLSVSAQGEELNAGSRGQQLVQALSAPATTGPIQITPMGSGGTEQQQQFVLSPDVAEVLAEELVKLRMAAPVLAQILGLEPFPQPATTSNTAAVTAPAAADQPGVAGVGLQHGAPVHTTPASAAGAPAAARASGTDPKAAVMASGSGASMEELQQLLAAAERHKTVLASQLQERNLQLQQLRNRLTAQQQELYDLRQQVGPRSQAAGAVEDRPQ